MGEFYEPLDYEAIERLKQQHRLFYRLTWVFRMLHLPLAEWHAKYRPDPRIAIALGYIERQAISDVPLDRFTCLECNGSELDKNGAPQCRSAWDMYNLDGDCLEEK